MNRVITLAAGIAALAFTAPAQAAITVYTTASDYLAAVGTPGTDTFESLSITDLTASPMTRTAGIYGYTAAATDGFFGAGSASDHWLSTNTSSDNIVFSAFTGGVRGVGGFFFGSNISGAFAAVTSITLSATDASGTTTRSITNPTTTSFLGFVSSGALLGVTINSPTQNQDTGPFFWATANNLVLGGAQTSAVPEPAGWAMMIVGFGVVGGVRRRRRAAVAATA